MAMIERYVLVDKQDNEDTHEYDDFAEAKRDAGDSHAVTARIYEYIDSELAWTPDGTDSWPPKKGTRTK